MRCPYSANPSFITCTNIDLSNDNFHEFNISNPGDVYLYSRVRSLGGPYVSRYGIMVWDKSYSAGGACPLGDASGDPCAGTYDDP